MPQNKKKKINPNDPKVKVARELGLYEKLQQGGWGALTASETGRIGGIIHSRNAQQKQKENQETKDQ